MPLFVVVLALLAVPVVVFGVVAVVALCRADRRDVPAVAGECAEVFRRLADRLPTARSAQNSARSVHRKEAE